METNFATSHMHYFVYFPLKKFALNLFWVSCDIWGTSYFSTWKEMSLNKYTSYNFWNSIFNFLPSVKINILIYLIHEDETVHLIHRMDSGEIWEILTFELEFLLISNVLWLWCIYWFNQSSWGKIIVLQNQKMSKNRSDKGPLFHIWLLFLFMFWSFAFRFLFLCLWFWSPPLLNSSVHILTYISARLNFQLMNLSVAHQRTENTKSVSSLIIYRLPIFIIS